MRRLTQPTGWCECTGFRVALYEDVDLNPDSEVIDLEQIEQIEQIVDVVDPIWTSENVQVTIDDETGQLTGTVDLIAKDKYYEGLAITEEELANQITLVIDGADLAGKALGVTKTITKLEDLEDGARYRLTISATLDGLKESDEAFEEAKANGRIYREYSGKTQVRIPAGAAKDTSGNTNQPCDAEIGHIDTIKPEIEKVSSEVDQEAGTETIIFNVIDKYINTEDLITGEDIKVYLDGEEAAGITKKVTLVNPQPAGLTATINGESQVVGQQYQLVLSKFEQARTSINSDRNFADWSGTVEIEIAAGAASDTSGNTNDVTPIDGDFTDVVKPQITYTYSSDDIDYENKTFTMIFDVTDKYFENCTLTTENLEDIIKEILVDSDGNIMEDNNVTKTITAIEDIKAGTAENPISKTIDGEIQTGLKDQLVGKRYTLLISNLEQSAMTAMGKDYLNYSGVISVSIPKDIATDTSGNKNDAKTITSGISTIEMKAAKPSELFDEEGTNANGLHIGDFVNYNAGTWTQSQIDAIQVGPKNSLVTANGSTNLPSTRLQFGGFVAGSSRNSNVKPINKDQNYIKDASTGEALTGWRVFDIEGDKVTLISAGNPEAYYHNGLNGENYAYISEFILTGNVNSSWSGNASDYQNRSWNDYVNVSQKAESATVLTKSELDRWYSKYIVADANTYIDETFQRIYNEYTEYQNMIDNNSYYWFCESYDSESLFFNRTYFRDLEYGTFGADGLRILVTLSSDALFSAEKTGTKTVTGGNTTTYGGDQTYNVWNIVLGDISGGTAEEKIVDVVDPLWSAAGPAIADTANRTASIDIKATDKYFASGDLTVDDLSVEVNGEIVTEGITVTVTEDTEAELEYGKKYTVQVDGYSSEAYQVKLIVKEGIMFDQSGNSNKEKVFTLISGLILTKDETEPTSPFLGNSNIERQKVEKVIFQTGLDGMNNNKWDASAAQDQSIMAWYTTTARGTYIVYIGSEYTINANPDSTCLFAHIGLHEDCAVTGDTPDNPIIENIELLETSSVMNMHAMFYGMGNSKMQSLDLGSNFVTSYVTDMGKMFTNCGGTNLDLGDKFDTSNVTNMEWMFSGSRVINLDLGAEDVNFDTKKVTNMAGMFSYMYSANSLNFGDKFDTSNVTDMSWMFDKFGWLGTVSSLNLGAEGVNFDTSNVTNMEYMFRLCGYNSLISLDLGDKFDTRNVTKMAIMFFECGWNTLESLDLGPLFLKLGYEGYDNDAYHAVRF